MHFKYILKETVSFGVLLKIEEKTALVIKFSVFLYIKCLLSLIFFVFLVIISVYSCDYWLHQFDLVICY